MKIIETEVEDDPLPLSDIFPFDYKGGGYFRRRGIPKGKWRSSYMENMWRSISMIKSKKS